MPRPFAMAASTSMKSSVIRTGSWELDWSPFR